jgi:hypothetical protein
MAVPTPPTAGEPIAEAWGDVVHDQVVAMEIQTKRFTVAAPGGSTFADAGIVFDHPFAAGSKPVVICTMESIDNIAISAGTTSITNVGFTCRISKGNGNLSAFAWSVMAVAYGPRA